MQSTVLTQFKIQMRKELKMLLLGMKLSIFLLILALQVNAKSSGQSRITLTAKNATLESVLKEISRQSGLDYAYQDQFKQKAQKVDLSVNNASLDDVLKICFQNQPFTFTIVKNTIVIRDKTDGIRVTSISSMIDELTGRVTNDKGEAIQGAAVVIKGTSKGTNTDDDGSFILRSVPDDAILTITSVGCYDTTVVVDGRKNIYIRVRVKMAELGQAVISVSTGYQHIPKERATGSFAFVSNELFNRSVSGDVISRLEGVVPGMLFNRNTSSNEITIRGHSTLFSDASPLIVVDNFPYDGDINGLNPNDIESITVLKDAAAASIWGVKSGNGVIVITTKKGKRNQAPSIDVNMNATIVQRPDVYYNPNFLKSSDFIYVEKTLFDKGYYDGQLSDATQPPVSPVVQLLNNVKNGTLSQSEADAQINAYKSIDYRNDLSKYFYRKAFSQQYSVAIRGGGEKNDYAISWGYDNNKFGLTGNKNERVTINANMNFYPVKNLVIFTGYNFIQSTSKSNSPVANIVTGGQYATAVYPYARLVDGKGAAMPIVRDYNYSWITDSTAQAGLLDWQFRPLDELRFADNTSKSSDNRINFGLQYKIIKGLSVQAKYQYEKALTTTSNYYSDSTYYTRNLINEYTDLTQANPQYTTYPIPIGGVLIQNNSQITSHRVRGELDYSANWSNMHSLTSIVGMEVNQTINSSITPNTVYGYDKSSGSTQNVDFVDYYANYPSGNYSLIPNNLSFSRSTDRYISYYGNAAYTYAGKYTLSASGRIDRSNLFGVSTNQQAVPLYSTGVLWNVSKESFYNLPWLPVFNLRASFGYNGNVNKTATAVTTISQASNNQFLGLPYNFIASPGNRFLRWERVRMINLAADFATKGRFLSGSIEVYFKKGSDLFGSSPLAPSTGNTTFFGNTADTKGVGTDISLNFNLIHSKKFTWTLNLISSTSVDRVEKYNVKSIPSQFLYASADGATITPSIGKQVFAIYSYKSAGLSHDNGDPQGYLNGKTSTDYANIIKNVSSVDSLVYFGSSRPTLFGSIRNTFTYGALTFSFNILYKANYYFRRQSIFYNALTSGWVGNKDFYMRWQKPGDENTTSVPSMPTDMANLNVQRDAFYRFSESLVTKGDHIRLQDISISYDIQTRMKKSFQNIRVYGYVNNIGILWRSNRYGLDPDVYAGGLPSPRSYSIGIKTSL